MPMQCPGCREEVLPDATVCPQCGTLLVPPVMPPPFPYHLYPYAAYTPQPLQCPPPPHGARIGAYLLDGIFGFLLAIPGVVLLFAFLLSMVPFNGKDSEALPTVFFMIIPLYFIALLPSMAYNFCKDGLKGGASWGKQICGLRVVHLETGRPCTFGRSCLRQILNLVNNGIVTLIEIIMVLSRPDRRRLGDQIAGTMVIPADTPTFVPQPWPQWQQPHYTQPYAGYAPPPPPGEADSHGPPPMR